MVWWNVSDDDDGGGDGRGGQTAQVSQLKLNKNECGGEGSLSKSAKKTRIPWHVQKKQILSQKRINCRQENTLESGIIPSLLYRGHSINTSLSFVLIKSLLAANYNNKSPPPPTVSLRKRHNNSDGGKNIR